MLKKILFLLILSSVAIGAQVNTEGYRRNFNSDRFYNQISLSSQYLQGNSDYLSLKCGYRGDFEFSKRSGFIVARYKKAESDTTDIQDNGFFHLRLISPLTRSLSLENFVQSEFDAFKDITERHLLGLSLRQKLLDNPRGLSLDLSTGIMIEHEVLENNEERSPLRSSNYIVLNYSLSRNSQVDSVTYIQPEFANPENIKILSENQLFIKLSKSLQFTSALNIAYNSDPAPGIEKTDISVEQGIVFQF